MKLELNSKKSVDSFVILIMAFLIGCLVLRFTSNFYFSSQTARNFTMTHLRIDSLMAGVLIAYLYIYKKKRLVTFFDKNETKLLLFSVLCIAWTPFIDPLPSFFVKTVGFSLVYIAFSIVLLFFLLNKSVNNKLNYMFSKRVANLISKIGFCSYSIYIIHTLIIKGIQYLSKKTDYSFQPYLSFILVLIISVLVGFFMTYKIEGWFLTIRDKYYPSK
ncbi:acyltransferase family protein [Bizionia sp.]|uniref:acyltransferase family protein n=1 Tax=Bizionia sp. TaxID=1954480 RepID=UPI003A92B018